MPEKIFKGAWCQVDKYLYLIGGTNGSRLNTIYRFDMEHKDIIKMNATLPDYISQSRAIYDGKGKIYIFGGTNNKNQLLKYIMKYDIEKDECSLLDTSLPYGLANVCATKVKDSIFILGGENAISNVILEYKNGIITSKK